MNESEKMEWNRIIGCAVVIIFESKHIGTKEYITEKFHSILSFNLSNNDKEKTSNCIV